MYRVLLSLRHRRAHPDQGLPHRLSLHPHLSVPRHLFRQRSQPSQPLQSPKCQYPVHHPLMWVPVLLKHTTTQVTIGLRVRQCLATASKARSCRLPMTLVDMEFLPLLGVSPRVFPHPSIRPIQRRPVVHIRILRLVPTLYKHALRSYSHPTLVLLHRLYLRQNPKRAT